jgi:ribosomal protein L40E
MRAAMLRVLLGDKGESMRFFRRKVSTNEEPDRCPLCGERLPDDAEECAMCGADLKALRPWSQRRGGAALQRD